ncbi:MAG: hypothetical protein RLZZ618_2809 [Pseudomonadota bacterium]|jgi:prolyl-tRNA editing enzyme YbaK/EbsC (Cys-tRNA(Pro) deacylase)/predicted Fe-S protein YdhL (DUF1289 family)
MSASHPPVVTEAVAHVTAWLASRGHAKPPVMLASAARTAREAAEVLGVQLGQIAKSIIFRRLSDGRAVLVVASGDKRVDERKLAALTGPLGRADAAFVKDRTGFSIGGVAPFAHRLPPVVFIDQTLQRFDEVWAAAGHPHAVVALAPAALAALTAAPFADVVQAVTSPCTDVCRMDAVSGLCAGCQRTREEIAAWSSMDDGARRALLVRLAERAVSMPQTRPIAAVPEPEFRS